MRPHTVPLASGRDVRRLVAAPTNGSGGSTVARLIDIEGIGDRSAEALRGAGVGSVAALLGGRGSAKGRDALAKSSGSGKQILRWVNHADLMRITGVGGQFAELLEAAGVDSVPELAKRRPDSLAAKMAETNTDEEAHPPRAHRDDGRRLGRRGQEHEAAPSRTSRGFVHRTSTPGK